MGITEKEIEKPVKKLNKVVIGIIISFCTLLVIYFGMVIFFLNHFYFGTEINSINVSGKTVMEVNKLMAAELQSYKLNLKERGGINEQIKAMDVGLKYSSGGEFKDFKDKQNPFKWILVCFTKKDTKMTEGVLYDNKLLKERVDKLSCFDSSKIIEPKNPSFRYTNNGYMILDEVEGNKVIKDILLAQVADAILMKKTNIDLDAINCYVKPQYTSKSQKVIEVKDILNKYVASKITYVFGGSREVLDGSTINKWLTVDDNLNITFDEGKVKNYIDMLTNTYNTIGRTRTFATSSGITINIGSGDYGWSINKAKEIQVLSTAIKEGKTMTKEPAYTQTALSRGQNDIGNTYVEIDLTKQHLWFYKNGTLVAQGDVVTGNVSANHSTPKGVYSLKYKQRNAILRGQDYAAPVNYWMPFNGGIGIHDASWRSVFGGNIYKTAGSHGCINCPYYLAKTIFENIEASTPVVCY